MEALIFVFVAALGLSLVLVPLAGRAGTRLGLVDLPRPGEVQRKPTPRTGGYGFFGAFWLAVLPTLLFVPRFPDEYPRLAGFAAGSLVILTLAVLDDRYRLGPLPQLAGQILAGITAAASGILIENIANPAGGLIPVPVWLAFPLTVFWVVVLVNTVNLTDTMDGLAGGVAFIAAAVLFANSFLLGQFSIALLPLALAGAVAGFLVYNFYPARVFMGSGGSMFLGYALAILAVIGGAKLATAAMVLGIAMLDVGWVFVYRLSRGRSPFKGGDSAHLPHRLLRLGLPEWGVALLYYGLCLLFGLLAVGLTRWAKVYGFAALALVAAVLLLVLARERPVRGAVTGEPVPEHPQGEGR